MLAQSFSYYRRCVLSPVTVAGNIARGPGKD